MKQRGGQSMTSCTDRSDSREEGSRKKTTARDTTTACVSGKIHYVIPVPLLFVARCTYQAVRQGHPQPIGGAKSGWRRNARALRDDGKTKQNGGQRRTGMGREGLVEQVDHPCIGICDKRLGHHLVTPEAAFTCASSLCLFSSLFSLLSSPFSLSS